MRDEKLRGENLQTKKCVSKENSSDENQFSYAADM